MRVDIDAAREKLTHWVLELNPHLDRSAVTPTTALLSERMITSLQVAELLLMLEELHGGPIDIRNLKAGAFKDIDTIVQTFLVGQT